MRTVNATQAKATLLALLDDVADGEEIEITRHGRTVARLVPARSGAALRGRFRGVAWTVDPTDDLLSTDERWSVEDE
jgi:prevent-host-death family protein